MKYLGIVVYMIGTPPELYSVLSMFQNSKLSAVAEKKRKRGIRGMYFSEKKKVVTSWKHGVC